MLAQLVQWIGSPAINAQERDRLDHELARRDLPSIADLRLHYLAMSGSRKSLYFILPIVSCLLGLLLVELLLAVFYPIPYSLEVNMYFEADPYTGYRHKPDTFGMYNADTPARANSQGNRDDEVAIPKPPGVFRILLIGDSFTVGANVQEAEAYGQVLERLLNASAGPED